MDMTDDQPTTLPRATRGTSFVPGVTTFTGTGTWVDPDGTLWVAEARCDAVTEVDLFVRTTVTDHYMTVDLVDASGLVCARAVQAFPAPEVAAPAPDDLTTRLLAAIEAEAQRDTHDRKCMLFIEPDEGWCDSDCRERTKRHCAAHRKIVERYERLTASASEDPTSVVAAVAAATAKADLVDLAAGYDLTTEPAP